MKNNPSNNKSVHVTPVTTSDTDEFFAEKIDPAQEARAQTLEAVSRVLIWIAEAASIKSRGVRATIMLYCVRPDLIGGITLERIGDDAGMTKQAAYNLAKDFRLCMGLSS